MTTQPEADLRNLMDESRAEIKAVFETVDGDTAIHPGDGWTLKDIIW